MEIRAKIREGKYKDAEILVLDLEKTNDNKHVQFYKGLIQNRLGNKKALSYEPNYYEAALNLGAIYLSAGRTDYAINIFESAVAMAGGVKRSRTLTLLGKAYNQGAFYGKAETSLLEALNNLSLTLKAQGRIDEAEAVLLKAVEKDGYYSKAYYNLGLIYLEKDEPQLALNSFKTVISLDPLHEQAWYNIGYLHSQRDP